MPWYAGAEGTAGAPGVVLAATVPSRVACAGPPARTACMFWRLEWSNIAIGYGIVLILASELRRAISANRKNAETWSCRHVETAQTGQLSPCSVHPIAKFDQTIPDSKHGRGTERKGTRTSKPHAGQGQTVRSPHARTGKKRPPWTTAVHLPRPHLAFRTVSPAPRRRDRPEMRRRGVYWGFRRFPTTMEHHL